MPTRPPVLLQRLKSAAAGLTKARRSSAQTAKNAGRRNAPDTIRSTLIPPTHIIRLAISRRFRLAVNEDGAEVIDVREGGTRAKQIAQALEEARGVVVGKKRGRIEAKFPRPQGGLAVDSCAGRIVGRTLAAVSAVCIPSKRRNAVRPLECNGERRRIFLVRPAAALATDRHPEFAARQDDGAAAGGVEFARFCGVRGRGPARPPLDIGAGGDAPGTRGPPRRLGPAEGGPPAGGQP